MLPPLRPRTALPAMHLIETTQHTAPHHRGTCTQHGPGRRPSTRTSYEQARSGLHGTQVSQGVFVVEREAVLQGVVDGAGVHQVVVHLHGSRHAWLATYKFWSICAE